MMTTVGNRTADHEIEPLFLERWSPRAFTGEAVPQADLMAMFEAARWAASSYNSQPWRFVYAIKGTASWEPVLSLLNDFNRSWAKEAGALVIIASNSLMLPPGAQKAIPSHSHSFDAGTSSAQLALQATKMGWHAHGMVGFDLDRAFAELDFPEGYRVECAVAIGRKGDPAILPEGIRAREMPSQRNPLSAIVFEGKFKA